MPRQPRLILDNVSYHVITRGNQKRITFIEDNDYETYLSYLCKYKARFDFKLYAWCLMFNHVHLLIDSVQLSKVMHGISLSYAQYFQYKYKNVGHFWQNRYKSYVVQKDRHLIDCITYIEYNPVRAKTVSRPEDYRWSSYRARILGKSSKLLDPLII